MISMATLEAIRLAIKETYAALIGGGMAESEICFLRSIEMGICKSSFLRMELGG